MNASVLPRFLLGSRRAILEIAASPWSIVVGAIFVLSAGLAREYDGEALVIEPWHALRPLGASLASGTALFFVVQLGLACKTIPAKGTRPPPLAAYRSFMGVFWMTAPMAWLYAIPYEQFMTPIAAITLNLWTLALVAVWRVVLMVRVVQVLYGIGPIASFFYVLLFADAVVIVILNVAALPVIDVMGGVRGSGRDALIGSVAMTTGLLAFLTAPVWLLGSLIVTAALKPSYPDLASFRPSRFPKALVAWAVGSVVVFAPLLLLTQPDQVRRFETEKLLAEGRVGEAFELMSSRTPADYPPGWDGPPQYGRRGDDGPGFKELWAAFRESWPTDWVAQMYLPKLREALRADIGALDGRYGSRWDSIQFGLEDGSLAQIEPAHREAAAALLEHAPPDSASAAALTLLVATAPSGPESDAPAETAP